MRATSTGHRPPRAQQTGHRAAGQSEFFGEGRLLPEEALWWQVGGSTRAAKHRIDQMGNAGAVGNGGQERRQQPRRRDERMRRRGGGSTEQLPSHHPHLRGPIIFIPGNPKLTAETWNHGIYITVGGGCYGLTCAPVPHSHAEAPTQCPTTAVSLGNKLAADVNR